MMMISSAIILACLMTPLVTANWDYATGFLKDYGVRPEWLATHKPKVITPHIQVSECSKNTRLSYPSVQLFALFVTNHIYDKNHGCPYGDCYAFTVAPEAKDMVPSFTDHHSFFWHETGGVSSAKLKDGTKPISNPQTGAYGYEDSLSGKFVSDKINTQSLQLDHDGNYPGFKNESIPRWTPEEIKPFEAYQLSQPLQPKCGTPCGFQRDPGSDKGTFGDYAAVKAEAYSPPPNWIPTARDTCYNKNGSHSGGGGYVGNPPPSNNATNSTQHPTPNDGSHNNTNSSHGHGGSSKTDPTKGGSSGNTHTLPGGHSSGKHCKKYCKCIRNSQDEQECSAKYGQCSQDDCEEPTTRRRRCL